MKNGCRFCLDSNEDVLDFGSVFAVRDFYPVTDGHFLIIPKRHVEDYFSMSRREKIDTDKAILVLKNKITNEDNNVNGFNIGTNCGISAGQTIFHAHIHLIPRRFGDTEDPRGGVRGVIPEKQRYK